MPRPARPRTPVRPRVPSSRGHTAAGPRVRASYPPVAVDVVIARSQLLGLYALLGVTVASWLARLPTVRAELGLSTGELGTVLLAGALGSLTMVLAAGSLATRWGSRRTLVVAAWAYAGASVLLGLGPWMGSVPVLTGGVVVMSMSFALGNVPLNVQTVVIERHMRRTVVPQFHAAFSVGAVAGSGLGALAAWGHLPLLVQFIAVGVVSLVWRLHAIPDAVLPEEPRPVPVRHAGSLRESLVAWREPRTLALGAVVMAGALSEGTANTWLAIGVVDGLHAREAVGALVFGAFVGSMTVARIGGTRLIDRYGRAAVLAASLSLAVAGLAGYALAPGMASAVLGAVAWGLGSGLVIPIGMASVTGHGPGAAGRVAVVSAFASTANLAAPPAIGVLAEAVGVRHAVLSVVAVMIVGMLLGRRVVEVAPEGAQAAVPPSPAAVERVAPLGSAAGQSTEVVTP